MKNLIEYVAGGLKVAEGDIPVSNDQKIELEHMERTGRIEVKAEQAEAEAQARRDAVKGKSVLNVLDGIKAGITALPKSFKGADAVGKEAQARRQLKDMCLDIMANRRSMGAKRNDKSGLAKASVDADLVHSIRQDIGKNKTIDSFLNSMSYKDLRELASSGHGGAMEEKLSAYIKNSAQIPADAPRHYMPTAKERVETLQAQMNTQSFRKQTPPADQRKLYIELMAARAAVGSKRGVRSTLSPTLDANILDQERKKFGEEPLRSALVRVTAMGSRQEAACEAALSGHGGALEDLVRTEIRRMALEKDSGYKMQNVDSRYAPTYDQRRQDVQDLIDSGKLTLKEQFRAVTELGVLAQETEDRRAGDPITNIESINRQTENRMALYGKIMNAGSMQEFVNDAKKLGYEEASRRFDSAHMGELKAIQMAEKLDKQLAEGPEKNDLPTIAAQKMVLLQKKTEFQQDKDNDKLSNALDKEEFNKSVDKLMRNHLFKEVCDKLGTEGLMAQAKGSGEKLIESFALAKEDKLEPYRPEAPADEKKGPQNEQVREEQQAGPQVG